MKVVLFCGGLGTRLREHSDAIPKSLVNVGYRPIIWHLMKYYAHFGHTEFILCLGYRGDMIRDYFLNYKETLTNDFTMSEGGKHIELHSRDIDSWRITFLDTGLHSNIGQRLLQTRRHIGDDEMFLANYSDGLSALPLDRQIRELQSSAAIASFAAVHMSQSFHAVNCDPQGVVTSLGPMHGQEMYINGGFFVFRRQIFDYIEPGDELVEKPFARLIAEKMLLAYRWKGYWQCMDTFKDKIAFDRMEARGQCPWMVWQEAPAETLLRSAIRAAQQPNLDAGRGGTRDQPEIQTRSLGDAEQIDAPVGKIEHP
jgi:glucose-1-phosphate cytidylyltransferase